MTTERRTKANQANARRSTGPRTRTGKRIVGLNSTKHGLLARSNVLPGEDQGEFESLRVAVHADLSPSGPVEAFLVDRVINTLWRLRRFERVETALLRHRIATNKLEELAADMRAYERSNLVEGYEMPLLGPQYETLIVDEAAHAAAKGRLTNAQKERDRQVSALERVIFTDLTGEEALTKLSRYETAIERRLYRTLQELQTFRAARAAKSTAAP
jgi:hypothetical protein